jgi:WD40 repeat protein
MEVVKVKNLQEPIILVKIMKNNTLLVVDSATTIRYFDKYDLSLLSGFKAKIYHKRYKTNVVAFSNDKKYFAAMSTDCREAKLFNIQTKKTVAKVDRHQGEVSCVGIDPSSRYMFSCGDDGKSFAVDVKSGKLVFTLPYHADTINDIAFSANSNWVATASYDRKISLFNLATMTPTQKLKAHAAPVMKLRFINKNRLISTDKNSSAIVWDVYTGKVLERLQGIHDDITQITTAENDQFLFVGTDLGYILVYDLDTYKLLSKQYIKLSSSITALEYDEENKFLIIGNDNGEVLFYNIYEGEEKLKPLLKQRRFDDITKMSSVNPILAYTQVYDLVANLWENTLSKAKLFLQKGDKKSAMALFEDFKHIPAKNSVIQKVLMEYGEFEKFEKFAKEGKYALAYGIANAHPMYKDSAVYRALEAKWKKAFALAQKYVLKPKGIDTAKDILSVYRGVSEKTKLIQELLSKGQIYKRFREAIAQKDFKIVFELIKKNQFLREFPEYDTIMNYADTLYMKATKLMEAGEVHAAIKMLRILSNFSDFEEEVSELMKEMESRQQFLNAVRDENTELIYDFLLKYEELLETDAGRKYNDMWLDALELANQHATRGDVAGVKKALAPYMKFSSKVTAIATVFSLCYVTQLEMAVRAKKPQRDIENGIKNYFLYFGEQEQILKFYDVFKRRYPESKLNIEHLRKGSLSQWRPAMIVNSILD